MRTPLLLLCTLFAVGTFAQTANFSGFNYQAVVRDASGDPLPNQAVSLRVHIYPGLSNGYSETHAVTTDGHGLLSIVVGEGTPEVGSAIATFSAINWDIGDQMNYSVDIDITGGSSYAPLAGGTFKAVPFAMHALTSSDGGSQPVDNDGDGWALPYDLDDTDAAINAGWGLVGGVLENSSTSGVRVIGEHHVQGNLINDGYIVTGSWLFMPGWDLDATVDRFLITEGGVGPRVAVLPGGNVGIGTVSPGATLHVMGDLKLEDGTQGAGKVLTSDADGTASWATPTGGGAHWSANGTDIHSSNTGNVGIGTTTPTDKLHVNGSARIVNTQFGNGITINAYATGDRNSLIDFRSFDSQNNQYGLRIIRGPGLNGTSEIGHVGSSVFRIRTWDPGSSLRFNVANQGDKMTILENGNVGIGTTSPSSLLHVAGTMDANNFKINGGSNDRKVEHISPCMNAGGDFIYADFWSCSNEFDFIDFRRGPTAKFRVTQGGNVYADGKIWAREVEVTLAAFPDYVFEPDYQLMPLSEVEDYVQENGHLPKVPSACEVEENGIGLGEMNRILLEKVEELTLHLIEKDAELKKLRADVDALLNR